MIDGHEYEGVPADFNILENIAVLYETMPGWLCDTTKIHIWEDLPLNTRNY